MRCWHADPDILDRLIEHLAPRYRVIAPLEGDDAVVRLDDTGPRAPLRAGAKGMLAAKKFLLPCAEEIPLGDNQPRAGRPLALLGLPPCDLHALTLLDTALADDPHYARRREGLITVGAACTPDETCCCLVPDSFNCDLFLDGTRLWTCSSAGEQLAAELTDPLQGHPEPSERARSLPERRFLPPDTAERFAALESDPLWQETASSCLACGACSAVCPTCWCFDLHDSIGTDLDAHRERRWDNCLFSEFALVAGGHDFRPGITSRLQFRMRHKLLGFGAMSGTPSCVGCGRCERYCPVDIGPKELIDRLAAPGGDA